MFTQWQNKWLVLSTASVTTANLQINTKTGGQWLVNWGDGNVDVVNSGVYKTHTYSTAYVGNVLVKPQSGGLNNIDGFSTNVGSWNFDLSVFLKVPNMTNQLYISGNSMAISGNLSSVPSGLTNQLYISGNSMAISGNLSSVPSGLTNQLVFSGALMTITGNLSSIPSGLTYRLILSGNSMTISGNLSGVPSGLTNLLNISGDSMAISGNLSSVPSGLTNAVILSGNSMTISGNLSSVPSGLTNAVILSGDSMAISGNLSSVPSGLTNQLVFSGALMNFTGDIKTSAPLATYYYYNTLLSTLSYTSGRVWKNMTNVTFALASSHLTVTEVNNMLVDLDASPLVTGAGTIDLRGNNATPTGAGLTAKSSLIAKGKTVYTN
jgi:hypothetical protein